MAQFAHGISAFDAGDAASLASPAWLLGRRFGAQDGDAYREAFESLLWFTYRRDFPRMEPYEYTSDAGWGCMLRSAQMLLGQALLRLALGRGWRAPRFAAGRDQLPRAYVQVLRWFADSPAPQCRYSIHRMAQLGLALDKLPGEWYGPTTAALVLRDLVNAHRRDAGAQLAMYVPQEGVVYSDDVARLCVSHLDDKAADTAQADQANQAQTNPDVAFFDPLLHPPARDEEREWAAALLILIPLRLGLDQLNERYVPALERTFAFPQSVGIVGGKKGHSVYFVGAQPGRLHLLDPHEVQAAAEPDESFPTATFLRSVHSSKPLVMNMASIDPSLALGFLCLDRADYLDFCDRVRGLQRDTGDALCPFSVAAHRPDYAAAGSMGDLLADCLSGDSMNEDAPSDDDDDYVLV